MSQVTETCAITEMHALTVTFMSSFFSKEHFLMLQLNRVKSGNVQLRTYFKYKEEKMLAFTFYITQQCARALFKNTSHLSLLFSVKDQNFSLS